MYKVKSVANKPKPPKSKAMVGTPKYAQYRAIDPSATPVKKYMKKIP